MLAAAHADLATVRILLEAGAETGIRNNKRELARDLAETAGNARVTELLEQHRSRGTMLTDWF
jgi:ankyrin repeat protein